MSNVKIPIRALMPGDVVHARSQDSKLDFADIVGLSVGGGQSPHMQEIALLVDVHFGFAETGSGTARLRLTLRQAQLLLALCNATVVPGTRYTHVLQTGHVEDQIKETGSQAASQNAKGALGAEVGGSLLGFSLKGSAKGEAAADTASGHAVESEKRIVQQLDLVTPGGQDSWNIGGSYGDPRRKTKDLQGAVITASLGEMLTPLCVIAATKPTSPVTGSLTVRANTSSLVLEPVGDGKIADIDAFLATVKQEVPDALKRRAKAEQELRRRVAGLAATRGWPRPRDGGSGTVDLAHLPFVVQPAEVPETKSGR